MKKRVLFVDDEPSMLTAIHRALHREPYEILTTTSAAEALKILEQGPVDVIVSDVVMPDCDGIELLQEIRKTYPNTKIIAISGNVNKDLYLKVMKLLGAQNILPKPIEMSELSRIIQSLFA